ncbi:MAG: APC family permease [Chloroflexi bacterium]|nr:APC family permease [Chloroflexota bacterium]
MSEVVRHIRQRRDEQRRRSITSMLLGQALETSEMPHQAIGKVVALAVFASDALSSVAYATDEILLVLAAAGTAAFAFSLPVAGAISLLLVILTLSYRQTIFAYPGGGGAYIVARDNLGEGAAQTAGAALMTDYILTVSVSVASGVAQLVSAFPELHSFRVELALVIIAFMTIMNLRGVKESGRVFAVPTYFFVGMIGLMLGVGLFRYLTGTLPQVTGVLHPVETGVETLSLFLVLHAFSSGCTALTGVEAISNGITAFREPKSRNAATTMLWMSGILMTTFLAITFLAGQAGVVPSKDETVISQLARTIMGASTPLYLLTIAATTLILIMAANTSFADFPRLAALHAGDRFLPRQLTFRGHRLVFSWGITLLAMLASLLIVVFEADVSALIPLYAIGVFLSFTLSQAGMVVRWWKISKLKPGDTIKTHGSMLEHDPRWHWKIAINAIGAAASFVVMIIFAVTKFPQGAWIVVVLVPTLVIVFFRIHHHYQRVATELSLRGKAVQMGPRPLKTILLVDDVHAATLRMVNFVKSTGEPWEGVHIAINPEKTEQVAQKWAERLPDAPPLVILESPYRSLTQPLVDYIQAYLKERPDAFVHVILSQITFDSYWEHALHQNSSIVFKLALQSMPRVVVTDVTYQLHVHANGKPAEVAGAASSGR